MLFEKVIEAIKILERLRNRSIDEMEDDPVLLGGVLWHST